MSNFFTPTNYGRVTKMLELFGHLETSAKANAATPNDWAALLEPVSKQLADLTEGAEGTTPPAAGKPTASHWMNAIHFAREVPIENAAAAIQILATRLEEHLEDQRKGSK